MFIRNDKYYFMWSEGGWTGPDYSVAYAISDSPFGPFERIGKILQQDPSIATGAGHHRLYGYPALRSIILSTIAGHLDKRTVIPGRYVLIKWNLMRMDS